MANNETCLHGKRAPITMLTHLPDNQGGSGRHKCCVCAYHQGLQDSSSKKKYSYETCQHGKKAPASLFSHLQVNQGGYGRHRCVICAYDEGFKSGRKKIAIPPPPSPLKGSLKLTNPPSFHQRKTKKKRKFIPHKKYQYVDSEAKNKALGLAGELLILNYEKESLKSHGRKDLSRKVEHVSVTQGDGAGYDIKSFTPKGDVKYIEVKTTCGGIKRNFFITQNEVDFSVIYQSKYYLYRVYDYDMGKKKGKLFIIPGNVKKKLNLSATLYRVSLA